MLLAQCTPKVADTTTTTTPAPTTPQQHEPFRSTAPKPGPAPRIQMGSYDQFELDNGLQVILVENHKLPRVSYQLFVDVPPFAEKDKTGATSIAGEMLSKGTRSRTKAELDETIDFMGARLSTNPNGMTAASLKKYNKELLELMSDVLMNPVFPEGEFDKIKKQIASGLAQQKEDPNALSANLSQMVVYGQQHPYGEFTTEKSLENIGLGDVKNYYQNWFKPNLSYLIIVGDITRAEAEPLVKQYFSKWKSDPRKAPRHDLRIYPAPGECRSFYQQARSSTIGHQRNLSRYIETRL